MESYFVHRHAAMLEQEKGSSTSCSTQVFTVLVYAVASLELSKTSQSIVRVPMWLSEEVRNSVLSESVTAVVSFGSVLTVSVCGDLIPVVVVETPVLTCPHTLRRIASYFNHKNRTACCFRTNNPA